MPMTAIMVMSTARRLDLPKRDDNRSAIEVMRWLWLMRTSRRRMNHQPIKTAMATLVSRNALTPATGAKLIAQRTRP